jgi:AraC family transcriptional regulator
MLPDQQSPPVLARPTGKRIEVPSIDETGFTIDNRLLLSSDTHHWPDMIVRCYDLEPHPELVTIPDECLSSSEGILLLLHGPHTLTTTCDGRAWQDRICPGNSIILPRGSVCAGRWQEPVQALHIYLDSHLIAKLASELGRGDPDRVELQWQFNTHDPLIRQIGLALKADIEQGCPISSLYAESLAYALALHLLRNYSSLTAFHVDAPCRGASRELRRVLAFIDEHIDQPLTLSSLAMVANLSPSYLIRQFKHTTGLAPHQYLIQRRVDRAKELLVAGKLTIAEVAASVGFADQSHLNRHFKRLLGVSPRQVVRVG